MLCKRPREGAALHVIFLVIVVVVYLREEVV